MTIHGSTVGVEGPGVRVQGLEFQFGCSVCGSTFFVVQECLWLRSVCGSGFRAGPESFFAFEHYKVQGQDPEGVAS